MTELIFKEEEKSLLLSVDRAKISSGNSQTIGRNGEIPFITFLNNYLPITLKAVSGHFVTPSSEKSPQLDVMIIDTRYPLLGYNSDGTILAMAHSVLKVIEVKTNLTKIDIKKTSNNFLKSRNLLKEVWDDKESDWKFPTFKLMAYRIASSFDNISNGYFQYCEPENAHFGVAVLRAEKNKDNGAFLHFEPTHHWKEKDKLKVKEYLKNNYLLMSMQERTPLADFYYSLIQNCYYIMDSRNFSIGDIGAHFNDYLNWTTFRY